MSAIERGLDSLGFLSDGLRDALRRRLRETGRRRADRARDAAGARARHLVGAGSDAQPRHQCAGAQPARHARRHRRRSADAAVRHRVARAGAAGRDLGLAARHAIAPLSRERLRLLFWIAAACCSPRASPPACRAPRPGRCRPGSAASSATRCCGCRPGSPAATLLGADRDRGGGRDRRRRRRSALAIAAGLRLARAPTPRSASAAR